MKKAQKPQPKAGVPRKSGIGMRLDGDRAETYKADIPYLSARLSESHQKLSSVPELSSGVSGGLGVSPVSGLSQTRNVILYNTAANGKRQSRIQNLKVGQAPSQVDNGSSHLKTQRKKLLSTSFNNTQQVKGSINS
uniref:Uncharacterized protein n=1 Tax=Strombidium rassoulzadegani TaxID=1082188 RepID=A0A7S3CM99_9SPIT|mmetsp:Transcript_14651/g.24967  ORF Transcript_14651/g.24967 Transcript_14651/m.24967 type:complete len:136 (+) Transcript_14651:165-572(+)